MNSTRQRIEDYLRSRLSADERDAFLQQVKTDTELRKELHTAEFAEKAIEQYASQRSDRTVIKQALQHSRQQQYRRLMMAAIIAAALVTGVLIYLLAYLPSSHQSPQALFQQYYQPYSPEGSLLGGSDTDQLAARYGRLRQAYLKHQCDSVQLLAPDLLAQPAFVDAPEARLLLANCLFQTGSQEAEALQQLALVPPSAADYFAEAQWYTTLVHLKQGDIPAARARLSFILANKNHPYFKQASDLVEALGPEPER